MPDGKDIYVKLPDGRYVHVPGDATPEQLSALKQKLGGTSTPSFLDKAGAVGREAALGAFSGLGIPEATTPEGVLKGVKEGLKEQGAAMFVRPWTNPSVETYKNMFAANPALAIPRGVVKTGLEAAEATGTRNMNIGPGVDVPYLGGAPDLPKFAHDLSSLMTQILMLKGGKEAAEKPIAESEVVKGAKVAAQGPKELLKTGMGAGERTIKEAEAEVSKANEAKMAKQRGVETENAKVTQARQTLQQKATQIAKAFTQMLDFTTKYIKSAFDSEYGEFDARVLGKSAENPKGTMTSNLSEFANNIEYAKKNLLEGSQEKITQFENALRLAEQQEGAVVDIGQRLMGMDVGATIPTVDLRGFITELQSRAYGRDLLPDVKKALEYVAEKGKEQVMDDVADKAGNQAAAVLKDLNSRYHDYLTDWRDPSKVNSLPALRNILYEGVVQNNPQVLADLDLAKKIPEGKVQTALTILKKYEDYGAKPELLQEYRKTLEQIKALPKPEKVPKVEPKQFNRGEFVRKKVEGRADKLVQYSVIWPIVSGIHALTKMSIPSIEEMLAGPAGAVVISNLMKSPRFIEWLAKERSK